MPLTAGTKLAHYEIVEPIGKGGMGEVYRAKDTKLGRDVAIKVLPDEFAQDEERLRRFQREAKVLASLNHPNIASIYGLEQSGGTHYLVLELVPGETLAERIARGPIPIEEALEIATKIAEALEEAHEQGIVHRDLKPANVKLTPDDKVKVLDFGLAKAFVEEGPGGDAATSMSPTITRDATRIGVILGTAAYMSPEQAKGKRVDRRADIWAFAVVLYEMLTGKRAFAGEDVSDTLAAVLRSEPDWGALPAEAGESLRLVLRLCLTKGVSKRLHAMGDVRLALEGAFEMSAPASDAPASTSLTGAWVAAVVATALLAGLGVWSLMRPDPPRVTRLTMSTPASSALRVSNGRRDLAISRQGDWLVYSGAGDDLYVRPIDRFETTRLDTPSPNSPFVSPDGNWIGYESANTLYRVPVQGGPPTVICSVPSGFRGASWGDDGTIIFGGATDGLFRVSASGGEPEPITKKADVGEVGHALPHVLPGNDAVLFAIETERPEANSLYQIAVVSLQTGEYRVLIRGGTSPRYVPSGHLVYATTSALVAIPFDIERLETTGEAVTIVSGIGPKFSGAVNFDVSDNGVMVYQRGNPVRADKSLVWVDRQGGEEAIPGEARPYTSVVISPEGDRVATHIGEAMGSQDLWIHNLARGTLARLTFAQSGASSFVAWTPNGRRVLFMSSRDGNALVWKAADGTGSPERVTERVFRPFSVSPDGTRLFGAVEQSGSSWDVAEVSLEGDATMRILIADPGTQWYPQISPSGEWLAYHSRESGRAEVFIVPYPNVDAGRWQVTTSGGTYPNWSESDEELVYRDGDRMMAVAVDVTEDGGIEVGAPEVLFEAHYDSGGAPHYDVSPDGQRFLMLKEAASDGAVDLTAIQVVLNWTEELNELVSSGN